MHRQPPETIGQNLHTSSTIVTAIVNHNTSKYAELALRSLLLTHTPPVSNPALKITVLDNWSNDEGLAELKAAAEQFRVSFVNTRWPRHATTLNTHGDALRDHVLANRDASYYLFIDADVAVTDKGVVWRMINEIEQAKDAWAIQAQYDRGGTMNLDAGVEQRFEVHVDDWPVLRFNGSYGPRCHPAFTLVRNSPHFLRTVESIGLGAGVILSHDAELGGFYDTFGLASAAMKVCGFRYSLSSVRVRHFGNVSYEPSVPKAYEAQNMLVNCRRGLLPSDICRS